jgi:hypothetical protein
MSRRRAVPFTAAAAAACLVLAACEVDPETEPEPETDAGISDEEVDEELEAPTDTSVIGEDSLFDVDGDTATIVVEVRNDDANRAVTATAPTWEGNAAFEVVGAGIVPPDVVLEDGLSVPGDVDGLEESVQLGPLESAGFTLQVTIDCGTEVDGDATFEVDTADGEVVTFAFTELDALTPGPGGTWAQQLQAEACDDDA